MSKKVYNENYEIGRIQTFINKFKNRQLRNLEQELNKTNKRTRRRKENNKVSTGK